MGAFTTLMGVETLSLRMDKHVANAVTVANWLENDSRVEAVTYAGLKSSPYYRRGRKICPKGAGALFTFQIKGGYDACVKLVDSVDLFSHVANLGDTRSLIIHSASTTHRQLSDGQRHGAPVDWNRGPGRPDRRPGPGFGEGHGLRLEPDSTGGVLVGIWWCLGGGLVVSENR